MQTMLITGGAGFIGSNFTRYILQNFSEYKVIVLDKLTYCGNMNNLKDLTNNPNFKFIKGDITDEKMVDNTINKSNGIDAIVHFAAESHVDRSIHDPRSFLETDVMGTLTLLEAARKADIKEFVQISTDEVYGQILDGSFKETDALRPRNPYSASKAGADRLAYSYFATYGLPVLITRSSNNFGPYQYPEKLIPLFITNLIQGKKVPVYGDGKNIRDWLYVIDNCEAIKFLMDKGKKGEVYNIGGGNERANLEITKIILNNLNKDESYMEFVNDRLGHDKRYSLDCSKIENLGWKPRFSFDEAIKETIEWYKNNDWWWKPLIKPTM